MKRIIHRTGETSSTGSPRVKVYFVHRPKTDIFKRITRRFKPSEKKLAKAKHKAHSKNEQRYNIERGKLIDSLAKTKFTPKMNLKVTLKPH